MDVKQDKRKRFFDIFYAVELFLQTLTKLPIKSSYKIDDLIQQSFCKGVAIVYPSLVSCGPTFDSQVHASFMIYFFLNGPFPASFSLFLSFQYTVDSKQLFNI